MSRVRAWMATAAGIVLAGAGAVSSQTAQHKHYERTAESEKPAPTGELAPRLQNLGAHTFPVTTRSPQAQKFIDQGISRPLSTVSTRNRTPSRVVNTSPV